MPKNSKNKRPSNGSRRSAYHGNAKKEDWNNTVSMANNSIVENTKSSPGKKLPVVNNKTGYKPSSNSTAAKIINNSNSNYSSAVPKYKIKSDVITVITPKKINIYSNVNNF